MILDVFEKAILEKRCVTVVHSGTTRRIVPHAVGFTSDGLPAVFGFQYAGDTTSTLPFKGEWRCLHFEHLTHASENGDRWRSPSNYSLSRQTCLKQIALAVPEATPEASS